MRRRSRAWIREADVVLFPSRRRSPPPPPNGPFRLAGGGFFWTPPRFPCPRPRHQAISLPGTLVSIPRGPALDLRLRRRPMGPLGRHPLGQSGGTVRPVPVGHLELGVRKPSWNNVVVRSARNKDRKTAFFVLSGWSPGQCRHRNHSFFVRLRNIYGVQIQGLYQM